MKCTTFLYNYSKVLNKTIRPEFKNTQHVLENPQTIPGSSASPNTASFKRLLLESPILLICHVKQSNL